MSEQTEAIVIVDAEKLRLSRDLISGPLTIKVGDTFFPSETWDDFIVVVLAWWLESARGIRTGMITRWEVSFMDGPYSFTLREEQGDRWQYKAVRHGTVQFTAPVSCSTFIESLTQAATAGKTAGTTRT